MKKIQYERPLWAVILEACVWFFIAASFLSLTVIDLREVKAERASEPAGYDSKEEWLMEMQVGYNSTFAELVNATQNYIDSAASTSGLRALPLVRECVVRKIPVSLALAQGEIESQFGTNGLARRTNSVWNVGAFDSLSVNKVLRYDHPNESVVPYLELLDTQYLRSKSVDDLLERFVNDKGQRYASDPLYESKLRDKYNEILTSTRIQRLQDQVDWYSLRL